MRQMTLGELISALERKEESSPLRFDFGYFYPSRLCSWRGAYEQLAITYESEGKCTVGQFLNILRDAVGKTFHGYKGGDYVMDERTRVWVANYGDSGNTVPVDVNDEGACVVIHTRFQGW